MQEIVKKTQTSSIDSPDDLEKQQKMRKKLLHKRYFNHKTRSNRCRNRIFHEKLHTSMYKRHIDHRSGAPWAPSFVKAEKFCRGKAATIFSGKGPHGGPHGPPWAPWAPWGPWGPQFARSCAAQFRKVHKHLHFPIFGVQNGSKKS